jgi:hypothetical protein
MYNMGVTTKKYKLSVRFCPKLVIFGKTVGANLRILTENLIFFKIRKNSYTGPLCITDPQYQSHNQEIRTFGQFLHRTDDIR